MSMVRTSLCSAPTRIRMEKSEGKGRRVSGAPFTRARESRYLMKNVFRFARPCAFENTYPPMREATNSRTLRFS
jgi:hypothetical protein